MKRYFIKINVPVFIIFFICCIHQPLKAQDSILERAKKQIADAEAAFAQMTAEQGIAQAFYYFADSTAVIKRQNDTLITGKENIRKFYSTTFYDSASVTWFPDFVQASAAGEMGYTFGKYTWKVKDSSGKSVEYHGVFHTVWKKNSNGEWKYVWD